MRYSKIKEIVIPSETIDKWQEIVDTISEILEVNAVLITKVSPPYIEVFTSSNINKNNNPYKAGDREKLPGLYCESTIQNNKKLLIPNALKDKKWENNPDIELGMISYLGFPIKWPNGEIFGTLCVLDSKENSYDKRAEKLLRESKGLIETHLGLIYENKELSEKENILDITLDLIDDGVIITTPQGTITKMNKVAENLTGWDIEKSIGKKLEKIFNIVNTKTKRAVENPIREVLKTGLIVGLANDITLIAKDGSEKIIADSLAPIKDKKGNILGVILVFRDITDKFKIIQSLKESEKRYKVLFKTMMEGCQIINRDWEFLYINDSSLEQMNLSKRAVIGNKVWDVFPGIRETEVFQRAKRSMEKRQAIEIEDKYTLSNGKEKYFRLRIYPVPEGIFVLADDMTERVNANNKLETENEWLKALYENSTDPIVILDNKHNVTDINEAFKRIFKFNLNEIKGDNLDEVMNRGQDNSADIELTSNILSENSVIKESTRYDKYGNAIECIVKGIPVIVAGKFIGGYAIYNDITDRKRREKEIIYSNYHDNLTDLYNRTFLEAEIERLDVKRQLPISIIMLDLNGLKLINDSYGHKAGDKLLIKTAEVLKNIFRDEDIITRWGGDEFVILLTQTSETIAEKLSKRIKNINENIEVFKGEKIPLSLAVGFAVKNDESNSVYELLKIAEDMLYKDKLLENKSMKSHLVETLLSTLKQKSQETNEHAKRMSDLAVNLGESIGLPETELNRLSLLAVLHDIGKTVIPEKILNKPMQLSKEEWNVIKEHPNTGYRICSEVEEFSHVADEILTHHEHWNGGGYPQGLKGEEIPILSRIISIVDAFDVMTHDRIYRKAMPKDEAIEELKRFAGKQFDPNLVKKFISIVNWI